MDARLNAARTSENFSRNEWLLVLAAMIYGFILDVGGFLAQGFLAFGHLSTSHPNVFVGWISVVPLVFMGLPLHSLFAAGTRTAPALAALFVGHLAYGSSSVLVVRLFGAPDASFAECMKIFPSLSFAVLVTAWLVEETMRTAPASGSGRLALVAFRAFACSGLAGIAVGPAILFGIARAFAAFIQAPDS